MVGAVRSDKHEGQRVGRATVRSAGRSSVRTADNHEGTLISATPLCEHDGTIEWRMKCERPARDRDELRSGEDEMSRAPTIGSSCARVHN